MTREHVILLTGFGAFLDVDTNPSLGVARALAADRELSASLGARLVAGELPVEFEAVPAALDAHLEAAEREGSVEAILALGVQRDATFRLERRARCVLASAKPDNAGVFAAGLALEPARDLGARADVEALAEALRAAGAPAVAISDDAGGYVCERTYHHVLARAEERGISAVFLHVPPAATLAPEAQAPFVAACLRALAREALGELRG